MAATRHTGSPNTYQMAYTPPQQQMQQAPIYSILPYYTGGYVSNPQPTPAPPTAPSTTPATTAAGPSANLQALLAAIPIAADGQVIAADFHNSLRAALITLAGEMGLGLTAPTTTFTFMPAFLQSGSAPNWMSTNFVATAAATKLVDIQFGALPDCRNAGMKVNVVVGAVRPSPIWPASVMSAARRLL